MSFEVILCRDKIPVPYHHMIWSEDENHMTISPQIIADIITHKYNDRVKPKIGLLMELFDIVQATECKSLPDIATAYVNVVFRYIVFNPPIGSVWEGLIASSNEDGIAITFSFFKDIWVPWPNLPDGSEFSQVEEVWTWKSDPDAEPIYYSQGEEARFRVCEVQYRAEKDQPLMLIIASMKTTGLGPKRWWANDDDDEAPA